VLEFGRLSGDDYLVHDQVNQRGYTSHPDNYISVTVQIVKKDLKVSLKGAPAEHLRPHASCAFAKVLPGRKDNDTLLWIESPDQLDGFAAHLLYAKQF
jgi:hypothetical protein